MLILEKEREYFCELSIDLKLIYERSLVFDVKY